MELKIANMERTVPGGVVTTIHWTAIIIDGEHGVSAFGSVSLPPKPETDPTFVPFDQLTEAEALNWLIEQMGEDRVAALESKLNAEIEAKKQPKIVTGLPWAVAPALEESAPVSEDPAPVFEDPVSDVETDAI